MVVLGHPLRRVTLIGFRGSGKSTVGAELATRLGWRFMDADSVLEERLACTIGEYIVRDGMAGFRRQESECLRSILASQDAIVLATGGGVILAPENREALRQSGGLVVYLEATVATVQERLRLDRTRPSLTGLGVVAEVPQLLAERAPLYQELAMLTLPATEEPSALAERIASEIRALP
jgi:shikimate kinase